MRGHLSGYINCIFCEPNCIFNIEIYLRRGDTCHVGTLFVSSQVLGPQDILPFVLTWLQFEKYIRQITVNASPLHQTVNVVEIWKYIHRSHVDNWEAFQNRLYTWGGGGGD